MSLVWKDTSFQLADQEKSAYNTEVNTRVRVLNKGGKLTQRKSLAVPPKGHSQASEQWPSLLPYIKEAT